MTRQRREATRLIGLPFSPRNLFGETIFHGRTVITAPIPIATRDYIEPKRALYLSPFYPSVCLRCQLEMPCRLFYSEESQRSTLDRSLDAPMINFFVTRFFDAGLILDFYSSQSDEYVRPKCFKNTP